MARGPRERPEVYSGAAEEAEADCRAGASTEAEECWEELGECGGL
jgi:hypothetical protein